MLGASWREWLEAALQLVFPPRCAVCDALLAPEEIEDCIHAECRNKLTFVGEHYCMHCGRPLEREGQEYCSDCGRGIAGSDFPGRGQNAFSCIEQGRGVFEYCGALKKTMYRFKYSNRREYARFLRQAACGRWGDWLLASGVEAVIPVPMYRGKKRRRGYNQAALFAEALAGQMGVVYLPNAVVRTRDTRPLKELNEKERKNILKNAFQTTKNIVQYKKVLLVDDIYTTGSTAEAVASQLLLAGVEKVYFLAACIGRGF